MSTQLMKMSNDEILASAKRFQKLSHWRHGDRKAFRDAKLLGIFDAATKHMDKARKVSAPHRLTDEDILASAQACVTKGEWAKRFWRHYQAARDRQLFERCTAHMPARAKMKPRKYSDEEIAAKAAECVTRKEFRHKYKAYWSAARHHGIYDKITAHMLPEVNPLTGGFIVYAYEFPDRHAYIGLTYKEEARKRRHTWDGRVFEHQQLSKLEPSYRVLDTNLPAAEAGSREKHWHEQYRAWGWKMLNRAEPGSLGMLGRVLRNWNLPVGDNDTVYMVTGVSGAGKSAVCQRVEAERQVYRVDYDKVKGKRGGIGLALSAATQQPLTILFDTAALVSTVIKHNSKLTFKLYCVIESPEVIRQRLEERGGKMTPGVYRRITRIASLAKRYGAKTGTAEEITAMLLTDLPSTAVVTA